MQPDMKTLLAGARSLVKTAVANPRPTSVDLGLDMDSMGGRLADYSGTSWGGSRAGRASHLSDAMGYETDSTVRHPLTHDLVNTLVGGGMGALLGGGLGYAGSKLLTPQQNAGQNAGIGAMAGGAVAGLTGLLGGRADRRDQMRAIADTYDAGADTDPSVRPQGAHAGITALLTPFGGAHRSGQTDIYEALNNKGRGPGGNTVSNGFLRNLANVLQLTPAGPASVMGTGTAQTISAAMRAQAVDRKRRLQAKQQRTNAPQEDTQKAAADNGMLQQLLDGGRNLVRKIDLKNPAHTGAIGAGVGALGGLASSALSNDEEEKLPLLSTLVGGGIGGTYGLGLGMMNKHMSPQLPHSPQVGTPAAPQSQKIAVAGITQAVSDPQVSPAKPAAAPQLTPQPIHVPRTPATVPGGSAGVRPAPAPAPNQKRVFHTHLPGVSRNTSEIIDTLLPAISPAASGVRQLQNGLSTATDPRLRQRAPAPAPAPNQKRVFHTHLPGVSRNTSEIIDTLLPAVSPVASGVRQIQNGLSTATDPRLRQQAPAPGM